MISYIIAIAIVISLFVLYGVVRPSPGCTGHCHGCDHNGCDSNSEEHHV